jgi:two-component system chemotaxis response regulator CheY
LDTKSDLSLTLKFQRSLVKAMFDPTTKVLIVDDMMTMRKLVGKVCKELGFTNLVEAADGIQAWEVIQSSSPPIGLIISDWNMPNCSGLDLCKRLRVDSRFGKTPFLMVTAEAEQHQVVEALKAGVDNYVVKPFTGPILAEKLESIHKKRSG